MHTLKDIALHHAATYYSKSYQPLTNIPTCLKASLLRELSFHISIESCSKNLTTSFFKSYVTFQLNSLHLETVLQIETNDCKDFTKWISWFFSFLARSNRIVKVNNRHLTLAMQKLTNDNYHKTLALIVYLIETNQFIQITSDHLGATMIFHINLIRKSFLTFILLQYVRKTRQHLRVTHSHLIFGFIINRKIQEDLKRDILVKYKKILYARFCFKDSVLNNVLDFLRSYYRKFSLKITNDIVKSALHSECGKNFFDVVHFATLCNHEVVISNTDVEKALKFFTFFEAMGLLKYVMRNNLLHEKYATKRLKHNPVKKRHNTILDFIDFSTFHLLAALNNTDSLATGLLINFLIVKKIFISLSEDHLKAALYASTDCYKIAWLLKYALKTTQCIRISRYHLEIIKDEKKLYHLLAYMSETNQSYARCIRTSICMCLQKENYAYEEYF